MTGKRAKFVSKTFLPKMAVGLIGIVITIETNMVYSLISFFDRSK